MLESLTMDQVGHLVKVAERRRKRELFDFALAVRAAFWANKQGWREFSDFLLREPGEEVIPSSKAQMRALKEWSRRKANG